MLAEAQGKYHGAVLGGGLAAAAAQYANEATRSPELPSALERVRNSLEGVLYAVEQLDLRLTGPVARQPMPVPDTAAQKIKAAMNTGFGSQLDEISEKLTLAHARLQHLTERLEF